MAEDKQSTDERRRVLEMVENGTISVDEATKMLAAMEEADAERHPPARDGAGKWIHIKVIDESDKVDIRLPFSLVRVVDSFIPKSARKEMEEQGVNLGQLADMLEGAEGGKLVEIEEEGGAYVAITVE